MRHCVVISFKSGGTIQMSHSTQHNQKQVTLSSLAPKSNRRRSSSERALIEQILSSHKKVYGADEVEFIPKLIDKHKDTEFTLSISLDGPEEIHDKVRAFKGAYKKA